MPNVIHAKGLTRSYGHIAAVEGLGDADIAVMQRYIDEHHE